MTIIVSETIECPNRADVIKHVQPYFEYIDASHFKCKNCGALIELKATRVRFTDNNKLKLELLLDWE